jgi:hypothetical protein
MTEEKKALETQPLQDSEYFKIPTGFASLTDRIAEGGFRHGELVVISSETRRPNPCLGTLTKSLADAGFFKHTKQIDQEVEGELYLHMDNLSGESKLTIQHNKLRRPNQYGAEERNQAMVGHGQLHLYRDANGKPYLTDGSFSGKPEFDEDPFAGIMMPKDETSGRVG